tara:strand:- start:305 stop:1030 length:726 start_codon:yes stop_codon:yes gene_type:complete
MAFTYFIAGTIKGVIGIGLPTTGMAILSFFVSPLVALGLNLMPMFITNSWQFFRADNHMKILKEYKFFAIFMIILILITSFYAVSLGDDLIRFLFGIIVVFFVLTNFLGFNPKIKNKKDTLMQISFGSLSGFLGGATSLWAMPISFYLLMKNLTPKQFVDASGFFILVGCFPVTIGYVYTEVFKIEMLLLGFTGSIFALIGFQLGENLREKINSNIFKKIVLIFFSLAGGKMIVQSVYNFV